MAENNDTFELRSEEVQDILTKVPHWMIRWGHVVILLLLFLVFLEYEYRKYHSDSSKCSSNYSSC